MAGCYVEYPTVVWLAETAAAQCSCPGVRCVSMAVTWGAGVSRNV